MPLLAPEPSLVTLARKKAALTRHYGPEDERALAAASALRVARLAAEIATLTDDERARLLPALITGPLTPAHLMALLASLHVTFPQED